ncbi:MAG: hypothetical protein D6696_12235 [Acidobacteria bacterium]|nr:MAG: hypothetical protein D6696_12235 [Acidobacteriota bacterium]
MCHQTVGLVQGALEEAGIVTASITLLAEISARIQPPRALAVPYPLGFPLGEAHNPALQLRVLRALLALTERDDVPVLERFEP